MWAIKGAQSTVYSSKALALDKARQLRFMVHIVGDIHQPLHAASYFSAQFPSGDRGGNDWPVAGFSWTTELHALWDGGLGQWQDDLVRPLNATGTAWVTALSASVRALYPVASLAPEIAVYNASTWAAESFKLAEDFVYTAPQAPAPIPDAYLQKGKAMVLRQLAIAGYRLASLMCVGWVARAPASVLVFKRTPQALLTHCNAIHNTRTHAFTPRTLMPLHARANPRPFSQFVFTTPQQAVYAKLGVPGLPRE